MFESPNRGLLDGRASGEVGVQVNGTREHNTCFARWRLGWCCVYAFFGSKPEARAELRRNDLWRCLRPTSLYRGWLERPVDHCSNRIEQCLRAECGHRGCDLAAQYGPHQPPPQPRHRQPRLLL